MIFKYLILSLFGLLNQKYKVYINLHGNSVSMKNMRNNYRKVASSIRRAIGIIFWLAISSAIILRFSHLDSKVFWHDEVYTELRVSGYKNIDPKNARLGRVLTKEELLNFQRVSDKKDLGDTLSSLKEDVHMPLYYTLLKYWQHMWGNSIIAIRSLSAIFGILLLPALYILARQLFESELAAQIIVSMVAVSPMFIRYSQDARPYSLWAFSVLVSTSLLLIGLKKNTVKNWFYYSVSIAVSFYSQLLSFYIYLGHFLYVLITTKLNIKVLSKYIIFSAIGVLLFAPWLLGVVIPKFGSMSAQTAWLKFPMPARDLFTEQITNLNHLFFSIDFTNTSNVLRYIIGFPLACLVVYSIYTVVKKNSISTWLLPTVLSLSSFIFLYQDLILGGQRTRINQYFLLSYVAIFIVVGFTIFSKVTSSNKKQSILWAGIYCIFIVVSTITNYQTSAKATWWGWSIFQVDMAEIINSADNPLVISQDRIGNIMPLFYLLEDNTKSLMFDTNKNILPENLNQYDVFLLNPSKEIKDMYASLSNKSVSNVYEYKEGFINIELYKSN